jgi:hypothetical protein
MKLISMSFSSIAISRAIRTMALTRTRLSDGRNQAEAIIAAP